MRIRISKRHVLGTLLAGLACFSFAFEQETKAHAAETLDSLRARAEKGSVGAQLKLGVMYETGQGVRRDYTEAARWYRKAAEQGHADGQLLLGLMYKGGQGVPQDYVEAYKWISLAASRAGIDDREKYAEAREELARKMTPQQIAEAQRQAREWKPKAAQESKEPADAVPRAK
jgi:TPR repeat protein